MQTLSYLENNKKHPISKFGLYLFPSNDVSLTD